MKPSLPAVTASAATFAIVALAGAGFVAVGNAQVAAPGLSANPVVLPSAVVPGSRATAFLFVGVACPISNRYAPFMAALRKEYRERGVQLVLVYSNRGTTEAEAARHAKSFGIDTLMRYVDRDQRLARLLGATVTPQAVVLDAEGRIRYRGRLDDGYVARGRARAAGADRHELTDALRALIGGKPVLVPQTQAVGCSIEWNQPAKPPKAAPVKPAKPASPPKSGGVTFSDGAVFTTTFAAVAPILNQNCVSCHRTGEIGPMPLDTYEDASRYAANIVQVAQQGQMPPWKPKDAAGTFHGERQLSRAQIDTLVQWALAGAPRGDSSKMAAPSKPAEGWQLGKPDLVLTMPEAWKLAANAPEVYRCFVLPTGLKEDRQVVAVEYRAGNKAVVHHVSGYIDTDGKGRAKDQAEAGQGYSSFCGPGFAPAGEMGAWAPGGGAEVLPPGVARTLPAGSDLIVQLHYHPNGKPETDVTQVGLYFAKTPAPKQFRQLAIRAFELEIPAGTRSHAVEQTYSLPFDTIVYTVTPHLHYLGRTFEMEATLPDGARRPLISIDDWDYNWQDTYTFKTPLSLPKGTVVRLRATYNNSVANARNPSRPPQNVGWGYAATDEMCIGYLGYTSDAPPTR